MRRLLPVVAVCAALGHFAGQAQETPKALDARLMRYPDVSQTQIAFTYAGDIWVAPKTGGVALRLSSPRGEELFPKFSPDGTEIAFTGVYDGNPDLYVVPASGGVPRRVTHHGASDRLLDWYPNGRSLLYASGMTSYKDRFSQIYQVAAEGGLPGKLPMPYGEFAALSPDGATIAYTPISTDFRTWKRYRGGMAPDIWLFNLTNLTATNLTSSVETESIPMWQGTTLYFLSDRDGNKRMNLWAYDTIRRNVRQLTRFTDYDVLFPSMGPGEIVFEQGGKLHLLNLESETHEPVAIQVVTDQATLRPRLENVSSLVRFGSISPTGQRALFEARGEVFSAPAEHGVVRNVTRSSGVAERYPAWSPDNKHIVYFSDRTGEYELTLRNANHTGEERVLTDLGPGYRYHPQWSPDSKRILWIDQAMKISVHDLETQETRTIDQQMWMYHGGLESFSVSWSPDSRWVAYAGDTEGRNSAIVIYDLQENRRHQVTSGFYDDNDPVFDSDGKYLFITTGRHFRPTYSELDNSWVYLDTVQLAAIPLRKDVPSPVAPRNDEEPDKQAVKEKKKEQSHKQTNEKDGKDKPANGDKDKPDAERDKDQSSKGDTEDKDKDDKETATDDKTGDKPPKPVQIDFDDFEERIVILPPKPMRYGNLGVISGKLLYRSLPRDGERETPLEYYDLEKRESKVILTDADAYEISVNREKLLVVKDGAYSIIEPKEGQNLNKKIALDGFETSVDPRAEWRQIFMDAWRFQRDYFYDPGLHGVDWQLMRERYLRLLDDAVTRWDVNYVLGELLGELNSSHTYRSGGDLEKAMERNVGYLGCDFVLTNGAFQITKIIEGASWDTEVRSPLKRPGITNVAEGHYLMAVNGLPLDPDKDPWAAFQGLADKPVLLTISTNASLDGAYDVLVQTLGSEGRLRNLAWINENRLRVEKLSDGQLAYVYVPDTGQNGQNELVRQWRGQVTKPGMIIDERFNSGGQIPDRFVELLNRPFRNFWGVRDGRDWPWPPVAHSGSKAMLINGWSGSGGDCFPFYFKDSKLGPLVGMRTWGGLIGITGAPSLVDGGNVTVPTFGIYSRDGEWIIEGYGVDPDIEVVDDPGLMARGGDPQLEKAVEAVLEELKRNPPPKVRKPSYPNRAN